MLEKKVLDNQARFRAIRGFVMYGSAFFWYFARRNVTSWREHALHFSVRLTQELQKKNDFYCRNSHFLCFGKKLSHSLREEKCKIRTK